jgi:LysR family nod box-dependent transcriptional activator
MKLSHFDLNLLRVLDTLLAEKSVTAASHRLGVTQPAVSGSLQRLRDAFDDQLLVRVGQGMELTPKARALIAPVRDALRRAQDVLEIETDFIPSKSQRTFTVAMSDYCAQIVLPGLVKRIAQEAPHLSCIVHETLRLDIVAMEAGEVDLQVRLENLRAFVPGGESRALRWLPLFNDRLVCVVADDHPIGASVTIEEYLSYPHVSAGTNQKFTMAHEAHRIANITVRDMITIGSVGRVPYLLSGSRMIALLPLRLVAPIAGPMGLRVVEPPFDITPITETAVWHRRSDSDPGHQWLRTTLAEVCLSLPMPKLPDGGRS